MTNLTIHEGPLGPMVLEDDGRELVQIRFGRGQAAGTGRSQVARRAIAALTAYFAGGELADVPLRLTGLTPFQSRVLEVLRRSVPPGQVITYGELAARCGRPGAARAVGTAMRKNPLPIFFPCHRVVASQGMGGYGAGLPRKRWLLGLERRRPG